MSDEEQEENPYYTKNQLFIEADNKTYCNLYNTLANTSSKSKLQGPALVYNIIKKSIHINDPN